jgi:hypothetical protein
MLIDNDLHAINRLFWPIRSGAHRAPGGSSHCTSCCTAPTAAVDPLLQDADDPTALLTSWAVSGRQMSHLY